MSDSEQCLNRLELGQLFMWIGANDDQIWLPMGKMSNSEECSNRLELDLISPLVNFSCELEQIMTRYDFLWARWVILSNVCVTFGESIYRSDGHWFLFGLELFTSCHCGCLGDHEGKGANGLGAIWRQRQWSWVLVVRGGDRRIMNVGWNIVHVNEELSDITLYTQRESY